MILGNILRGVGGEPEIGRVLLASAGGSSIFAPLVFEAWDMTRGAHFDVVAFCTAYPGGLAVLAGAGVLAIGNKDKAVAAARQTVAQPPLADKTGDSA